MPLRKRAKSIEKMPKLIEIGNSVRFVISKAMLKSMGWKKGDYVSMKYVQEDDELVISNFAEK